MNANTLTITAALLILLAAVFLRAPALDNRPMHGDEAVNAFKFRDLWQKGEYVYDPHEYHGPALPYLTLPAPALDGAADFAATTESTYRAVSAVFGVALVLLTLGFCSGLGRGAALAAALLCAISPAMVFHSRYYIHEMLLVAFTAAALLAGLRYCRTRHIGWALACGVCLGLMHATKETCIIAYFAMVVALAVTMISGRVHLRRAAMRPSHIAAAVLAAMLVSIVLFSSFFTNPIGPVDSLRAFVDYAFRGFSGQGSDIPHMHPFGWYISRLTWHRPVAGGPWWSEALILLLGAAGFVAAWFGGARCCVRENARDDQTNQSCAADSLLPRFLAVYSLVMLLIYSLISYKTPWSILSALHGVILLAGIGAMVVIQAARPTAVKIVIAIVLGAACAQLGWQAWRAAFVLHTHRTNPYVYAHPVPKVREIEQRALQIAAVSPQGNDMLIYVIDARNIWPLPFYLRRFPNTGYFPDAAQTPDTPEHLNAAMIIVDPARAAELKQRLGDAYAVPQFFGLRPDAQVLAYIRRDLWESFLADQSR